MQLIANQCGPGKTAQAETAQPRWIVIYGGHPENVQRRSWGADMARVADTLIRSGQWVIWREGPSVHCRHRSQVLA